MKVKEDKGGEGEGGGERRMVDIFIVFPSSAVTVTL